MINFTAVIYRLFLPEIILQRTEKVSNYRFELETHVDVFLTTHNLNI
jgi:hypothetical protein